MKWGMMHDVYAKIIIIIFFEFIEGLVKVIVNIIIKNFIA